MDAIVDDFVWVSCAPSCSPPPADAEPEHLAEISDFVDGLASELWPVNKKIHDNPELAFKERIAHDTLTAYMDTKKGWKVYRSVYGMDTAWIAVNDSGQRGPVISLNVEMDALKSIGHACGHNLIATASVAGGLAAAEMMHRNRLRGKVVMFGTPGEEGGGGKIKLLKAGAYKDHGVDVSLISHPGIVQDCALVRTNAYQAFKVEYFGREAHAAASPWLGINALDALITAYNAISVLRQQTMPGDIVQMSISDGGLRPNIIHAYSAGHVVVRAHRKERLSQLLEKVESCFSTLR